MFSTRSSTLAAVQLVLSLVLLCGVFAAVEWAFGDRRAVLALETGALNRGEVYRLFTAHFVHLSATHTFMNGLGLLLVACTLSGALTVRGLIIASLASMAMISAGWWALQPPGVTYVGFSATLYGLFAFGALAYLRGGPAWFGWVVLVSLVIKMGLEIVTGPVPGANETIGGRVSTFAHGLGGLGGALAGPSAGFAKPILIVLTLAAIGAGYLHELGLVAVPAHG